jgi:ribonuclease HII
LQRAALWCEPCIIVRQRTAIHGNDGQEKALSASAAKLRLLKSLKCTTRFERAACESGARLVAGVDEVGRGSLFGCVVAGACILNPADRIRGLRDSKLLPEGDREKLAARIRHRAIAWAVAEVDVGRIDQINIYQASLLAMKLAVERLDPRPDFLLVDAAVLDFDCAQEKIIHGDALSASCAPGIRSILNMGWPETRGTRRRDTCRRCASLGPLRCTGRATRQWPAPAETGN